MGYLNEPAWVRLARSWIGTKEIAGIKHNPKIVGIWTAIGMPWFKDDETPWCAGALAYWMKNTPGCLPPPKKAAAALSWLSYGRGLEQPCVGAIAVKKRKGGGHVTIVVGRFTNGKLACLGANQDDQVKISPYSDDAFETFRWPTGKYPLPERYNLPMLTMSGEVFDGRES